MAASSKHVIGATATITESTSGLQFAARIDTGATTCSIHAEKWVIEDPSRQPAQNIGKPIRVLIKNEKGDQAWVDAVVAGRVQVRSSVQREDDYHGRYKVRLPLEWNGVKKEVLVTINDRTDMAYPLLIGRNFLRGDFLVDVERDSADGRDE
ncbi:MAG: RimK/LysX family protein [Pirellulales bacterium]